jgi:HD-like signal output (HDOD) protein
MAVERVESDQIARLIERADRIHTAPQVAQSLLRLTQDIDFDIYEVVACIEKDPALVARMLRIVNSSHYGLRHPVGNLQQAVAYLGQRTLRLIAMTFSIVEVFTRGAAKRLYADYWKQALTTATVASRLGQHDETVDLNDAYTAGLLADLGTLVMAQAESGRYIAIYRERKSGGGLVRAEREEFGFDHALVSARILEQWKFPADVVAAVREHHEEKPDADPLVTAARAGDLLGDVLWIPNTPSVATACDLIRDTYQLDLDGFTDLALACKDEITLEAEIFGINLDEPIDHQSLLDEASGRFLETSLEAAMDMDSFTSALAGPLVD